MTALGLALAACGSDAPPTSGETSASANAVQPEGSWTMVRWLVRRSDTATSRGQAVERRIALTPSCATGRCDVAVAPDGVGGTYLPEGYTASAGGRPPAPYALSWTEAGAYQSTDPPAIVSCTTTDAKVIEDGYEVTSTLSLTFTPAQPDRPAALRGTYTEKVKGVGAAVAAGCSDYESVWTVAAAPTTDAPDTRPDLTGTYVVTEVVEAVVPAGSRRPGFAGILLPSAKVEKAASGYLVTGTATKPVALAATATGWGGEVTAPIGCDPGTGNVADGYIQIERWSRLRPVVSTEDGRPIVVGGWEARWTPTAAGAAAGCTATSNKGYVLLVPTTAVPTG